MMNAIELNVYTLTLCSKLKQASKQLKSVKNNFYDFALKSGMEFVCSDSYRMFVEKLDSIDYYMNVILKEFNSKLKFTQEDFSEFVKYVLSKCYVTEDGELIYMGCKNE